MSRFALGLLVFAAALCVFGWWGTKTTAGRQRYDEMAGIIPELSYYAGWFLGGIALLWLAISIYRARG